MNRKEQQVESLLTPTVQSLGCEIWGIEYLSQGKHTKLRIYIDREEGVDVDNCAEVSRHVSDILDVEEFSNSAYTLEVSSPGMDRILFKEAQYADYAGHRVEVRLNFPFEGRKKFVGLLAGVEDQAVLVQIDDDEFVLPIENIQRARLVPEFETKRDKAGSKPGAKSGKHKAGNKNSGNDESGNEEAGDKERGNKEPGAEQAGE